MGGSVSRLRKLFAVATVVAVGALGFAGVRSSGARFVAATENDGTLLSAARIDLVPGTTAHVRFDASGVNPGVVMERCIAVTYRGTILPSLVRLHGTVVGGTGLEAYIDATVDTGTGGSSGHCDGFTADGTTHYHDTLAGLAAEHGDFADGVAEWRATTAGATHVYRVRVEVLGDNAAHGRSTNFDLAWSVGPDT
jgi:hypothetical protein